MDSGPVQELPAVVAGNHANRRYVKASTAPCLNHMSAGVLATIQTESTSKPALPLAERAHICMSVFWQEGKQKVHPGRFAYSVKFLSIRVLFTRS